VSHEELRVIAMRYAKKLEWKEHRSVGFGCGVIASEVTTAANDIPDVIGWRSGWSYLIECKASRSDFFADRKKPQRNNGTGMGNFRYFMVPSGLIKPEELPAEWGLLEVEGRSVTETVRCKLRDLDTAAEREEKRVLLSLIRRIKAREFLILQDERPELVEAFREAVSE
jgi:hypothetical protein